VAEYRPGTAAVVVRAAAPQIPTVEQAHQVLAARLVGVASDQDLSELVVVATRKRLLE
jgi:hypothetical protein